MSEELAPIDSAPLAPLSEMPGGMSVWDLLPGRSAVQSSFDRKNKDHQALMIKCLSDPDVKGQDAVNRSFNVIHVLTTVRESIDRNTGEVQKFPWVALCDDQAQVIAFGSVGILGSVADLMAVFGPPPWQPPIPVTVRAVQTAPDRRTFKLVFDNGAKRPKGK